ncbi:MAG: sigma-54-dependent transcriptional regulator [Myxococcota bacterium]
MTTERVSSPSRILVVDDDPSIRKIVRDRLAAGGHEVITANDGVEALKEVEASDPALVILDLRMPNLDGFGVLSALEQHGSRPEVVVLTAHGSVEAAVQAVRLGACDFLQKPFDTAHLEWVVERTLDSARLRRKVTQLQTELSGQHSLIAGESPAMQTAVRTAERAARTSATVLLLGESGSGKEVLARYIHRQSDRASGPFVALNCATLGRELLESELFGHERGAFTGAVRDKPGRLEQATGGTLLLDEIAEMSPELQAKFLRVLQEREFQRVGGTRLRTVDVRVVAATHRDLTREIGEGRFREDLYYRLNVISIPVPPLRERPEDVPVLIDHFLAKHANEVGRPRLSLSDRARELLLCYDWPGNVRELSNAIERCMVLAEGDPIDVMDLPEEVRDGSCESRPPPPVAPAAEVGLGQLGYHEAVVEAKRRIIAAALAETGNHQTRAAELLGLGQPYLARLMKNLGMKLRK